MFAWTALHINCYTVISRKRMSLEGRISRKKKSADQSLFYPTGCNPASRCSLRDKKTGVPLDQSDFLRHPYIGYTQE